MEQQMPAFPDEVRSVWEQNAAFWDESMGDGNAFQRFLIAPAVEHLMQIQPGQVILDLACGNGVFSRRMAELGASVVATDFSEAMVEKAQARTSEYASRIEYHVLDATNKEQIISLGKQRFDSVYCGMAIQDIIDIEPMFSAIPQILKPGGHFVFSIPHPAFNNSYIRRVIEEEDRQGEIIVQYAIKITGYSEPRTDKGIGIIGQPAAQYYFHRPMSLIYQYAFQNGFVLDGVQEPTFGPEHESKRPFGWQNFKGIPPILISRMRLG